jgi:hypothetical protein
VDVADFLSGGRMDSLVFMLTLLALWGASLMWRARGARQRVAVAIADDPALSDAERATMLKEANRLLSRDQRGTIALTVLSALGAAVVQLSLL